MSGAARKFALAMLLAASACAASAEQEILDRLFFTPEERAEIDRLREGKQPLAEPAREPLTLNGRVLRSSGRNTAWINGVPMDEKEARNLSRMPLRAGQSIGTTSQDRVTDILNGGTITIHRKSERP